MNSINKKEQFLTIFSFDYGKIKTVKKISKSEKEVDIGNIINFEINTKENSDIHKISNIKIKSELNYQDYEYKIVEQYLKLIGEIKNKTPEGVKIIEIFQIIEILNDLEEIDKHKILLSRLKLHNIIGELDIEHKDKTINKILKFINNSKINKIILLNGITKEIEKELEDLLI